MLRIVHITIYRREIDRIRVGMKLIIDHLPIRHVIVFATPTPKRIRETIDGSELFHCHRRYAAEYRIVWQSGWNWMEASECE